MKKNILITGGSSGIGAALAELYRGNDTVYVTASKNRCDAASDTNFIVADQHDPIVAAEAIYLGLHAAGVTNLDLAILNAGIGFWRMPQNETAEEIRATLTVNVAATIAIAHRLFPLLEAANGTLVLIGSASHKGNKNLATYAASKAALDGLARALQSEWRGRVRVQIIHPGATATPMHGKAGLAVGKMGALFASPETSAKMISSIIGSKRYRVTLSPMRRLLFAVTQSARP